MSLRRKKYPTYNRMEMKEETQYWMHLLFQEEHHEWDDFDEYGAWGIMWWDYDGGGAVMSMDELNQMHLMTLLRKLNIKTAKQIANERGW